MSAENCESVFVSHRTTRVGLRAAWQVASQPRGLAVLLLAWALLGHSASALGAASCAGSPNGTPCDDGDACTQLDSCQAGVCTGAFPVICSAMDQCHVAGTCNPAAGTCSNPAASDGTACNDGDLCSQTDSCQTGVCTGANPVTCTALDQCHVAGTCNSGSGSCSNPAASDGTSCSDGDLCSQADSCQTGACTGSPVVCGALDSCHPASSCFPGSGACVAPQPDRVACGLTATGSGLETVSFTTTDPRCTFSSSAWVPTSTVPAPPPLGTTFPHGLFAFRVSGCAPGATVNFSVRTTAPRPPGTQYLKYGPTPTNPVPSWYALPASVTAAAIDFSITDGGIGDDNVATQDGEIVDPGGPAEAAVVVIPALSSRGLAALVAALALAGLVVLAWRGRVH